VEGRDAAERCGGIRPAGRKRGVLAATGVGGVVNPLVLGRVGDRIDLVLEIRQDLVGSILGGLCLLKLHHLLLKSILLLLHLLELLGTHSKQRHGGKGSEWQRAVSRGIGAMHEPSGDIAWGAVA